MRIHETTTYPAPLADVVDALISRELAEARARAFKAEQPRHTVDGLTATTVVPIPADQVPDFARPFLKNTSEITITQEWDGRGPAKAHAPFNVNVGKLPVVITLAQDLVADGETTRCTFSGELKVKIPIVGGRVEKKIAEQLTKLLRKDTAIVTKIIS